MCDQESAPAPSSGCLKYLAHLSNVCTVVSHGANVFYVLNLLDPVTVCLRVPDGQRPGTVAQEPK